MRFTCTAANNTVHSPSCRHLRFEVAVNEASVYWLSMTTSTLETCSVPAWVVSLGREKHCLSSSANARTRSLLETRFKEKSSGVRTAIDAGKTFGVSSLLAYSSCAKTLHNKTGTCQLFWIFEAREVLDFWLQVLKVGLDDDFRSLFGYLSPINCLNGIEKSHQFNNFSSAWCREASKWNEHPLDACSMHS